MPDNPATSDRYRAVARRIIQSLVKELSQRLTTNQAAIELSVMTLAAGGHLLLEDVPGIGKTTLARALAACIQAQANRIQFTSDMLPSDLTGITVFDQRTHEFTFFRGPLFAEVVLADEINRANPKTQAALLEAMEERRVTVDGTTYDLPRPHLVIATQNPVEMEGTYPLPEAQLDRFMTCTHLGYPAPEAEARMLMQPGGRDPLTGLKPVCTTSDMNAVIQTVAHVHVAPEVARYVVDLLAATRHDGRIALGASPRAGLALIAMSKARALLAGQNAVYPADVRAMAAPALAHRLILADATATPEERSQLIDAVLSSVPAPRGTSRS